MAAVTLGDVYINGFDFCVSQVVEVVDSGESSTPRFSPAAHTFKVGDGKMRDKDLVELAESRYVVDVRHRSCR